MVREVVFGVGFAFLLPIFFELDGVLYSMLASDLLTAVLSAIIFTYWKLNGNTKKKLKEAMIHGSKAIQLLAL